MASLPTLSVSGALLITRLNLLLWTAGFPGGLFLLIDASSCLWYTPATNQ